MGISCRPPTPPGGFWRMRSNVSPAGTDSSFARSDSYLTGSTTGGGARRLPPGPADRSPPPGRIHIFLARLPVGGRADRHQGGRTDHHARSDSYLTGSTTGGRAAMLFA